MRTIFVIFAALVVTMVVAIIAMPLFAFVILLPFAWRIQYASERYKSSVLTMLQTLCYGLSQFAALVAGAAVLRSSNLMRFFPLLIAGIALSCLRHVDRRTTLIKGRQLKKGDIIANIVSTVIAIVAAYLVVSRWYLHKDTSG